MHDYNNARSSWWNSEGLTDLSFLFQLENLQKMWLKEFYQVRNSSDLLICLTGSAPPVHLRCDWLTFMTSRSDTDVTVDLCTENDV